MAVVHNEGPHYIYGADPTQFNAQRGPSLYDQSAGLMDPRTGFTYVPGQPTNSPVYGFLGLSQMPVVDQVPSAISASNIAASQAVTTAVPMTLVSASGAGITVGVSITNAATLATVTGLLAIDVAQTPVRFGQGGTGSGGPTAIWDPTKSVARTVRITTNADDTGGFYTVAGYDLYGFPMSQKVTGVSSAVCTTTKAFKYIASVTPSGTINSTLVSVGTGDTYGLPLRADRIPYTSIWWGTPLTFIEGGTVAQQTTMEIPVILSQLANAGVYNLDVPFDGTLISINFRVTTAATTAAKAATLTAQANGTSVTGGVLALTSANCTPIGAGVSGTAITGGNTFTAGQTVGFVVSSVTAFSEGEGIVELVVQNADDSGGTFTAAVTTSPATQTTGDTRGTFAVPSASDGTKRLVIFETPSVANVSSITGLFGVTQV